MHTFGVFRNSYIRRCRKWPAKPCMLADISARIENPVTYATMDLQKYASMLCNPCCLISTHPAFHFVAVPEAIWPWNIHVRELRSRKPLIDHHCPAHSGNGEKNFLKKCRDCHDCWPGYFAIQDDIGGCTSTRRVGAIYQS